MSDQNERPDWLAHVLAMSCCGGSVEHRRDCLLRPTPGMYRLRPKEADTA